MTTPKWLEEPSNVEFEYKGYKCEIVRHSILLHLCGYVYCKNKRSYDKYNDLNVHGGITYNNDDTMKIGFDCAHCWDHVPGCGYNERRKESYKDIDFVTNELHNLVDQIKTIEEEVVV